MGQCTSAAITEVNNDDQEIDQDAEYSPLVQKLIDRSNKC